jgi:hypothetical protein
MLFLGNLFILLSVHRQTSMIFYFQAALAGVEIGYFNAGYLCKELKV